MAPRATFCRCKLLLKNIHFSSPVCNSLNTLLFDTKFTLFSLESRPCRWHRPNAHRIHHTDDQKYVWPCISLLLTCLPFTCRSGQNYLANSHAKNFAETVYSAPSDTRCSARHFAPNMSDDFGCMYRSLVLRSTPALVSDFGYLGHLDRNFKRSPRSHLWRDSRQTWPA
jgi:hypothetical protein